VVLRFTFLGYEYASIALDIERSEPQPIGTLVESVVDGVSGWWVGRMLKRGH
jgi:hypothetical protein